MDYSDEDEGYNEDENDGYSEDEDNGSSNIVPQNKPKLPALFKDLGLGTVSTKDKFTVSYSGGTLKATVKRPTGVAQTVIRSVGAGFRALTEFDPNAMKSKAERNTYIRSAAKDGKTQQELAEQFGLSQSMISKVIREDR